MSQNKGHSVFIDPINQKVSLLTFRVSDDYYINVNDITDALNCDTDWISEAEADWEELESEGYDYTSVDFSNAVKTKQISDYSAWYEVDRDENPRWDTKSWLTNYEFKNDEIVYNTNGAVLITKEHDLLFSEEECEDFLRSVKITFGE